MKKLLFLFMLIATAVQLKAQAKFEIKPFNKLPDSFLKKPYEYKFGDSLTRVFPQKPNRANPQIVDNRKPDSSRQYAYNPMPIAKPNIVSNMPVVKMQGNSKMPVVNPDAGDIRIRRSTAP
ncbi:MAG: hypothetical protein EOP47_01570 [Sphingobacteriaceae bacterium]|nr:MAG: hypothetical protein EOP47_01570 [Sphingobacteriaceae bacterium]